MPLTGAELDIVNALAWPLPADRRSEFALAVEAATLAWPEQARGPGLVHRIGADLQKRFWDAPPKPSSPQHLNDRKLRSVARSTALPTRVRSDAR
jgi:hypothetical protein